MSLETHKMVCLSTGHITEQTCNNWLPANSSSRYYEKGEWGWFVHVPEDGYLRTDEDLPPDLARCIHFARQRGFDWIMFDQDGPVVDHLPTYDW